MNKIHIINGSPRKEASTSYYLSQIIGDYFDDYKNHFIHDFSFDEINDGDTLLFAAPVYVDGLPSTMIEFLENFHDDLMKKDLSLYGYCIVNCGFPESEQTRIATDIIRNFFNESNIQWGGALGIGAGEFLLNSKSLPMKSRIKMPIYKNMLFFANAIDEQSKFGTVFVEPKLPKLLFKWVSTLHWYRLGKKNGLKKNDIK